jgi:thiamine biosynthesis lipoprotein
MGADVVVAGERFDDVRRLFDDWERTFSRFRPDSELVRVNATDSEVVAVTPLFARVVRTARAAAAATNGLVDPTLGRAIEAAGYDRDFGELEDAAPIGPTAPGCWRAIRMAGVLLSRPRGVRLDLNGVVKALAVDEAARLVGRDGFVAAGGDVAVTGAAVVALPGGGSVRLLRGGMATSGSTYRRWMRGGALQHHLIDPRTGRPNPSCWTQVTVAAGSCVAADVAAKAAFLLGEEGPEWLAERGLPGRFVADEDIVCNGAWRRALDRAAVAC